MALVQWCSGFWFLFSMCVSLHSQPTKVMSASLPATYLPTYLTYPTPVNPTQSHSATTILRTYFEDTSQILRSVENIPIQRLSVPLFSIPIASPQNFGLPFQIVALERLLLDYLSILLLDNSITPQIFFHRQNLVGSTDCGIRI